MTKRITKVIMSAFVATAMIVANTSTAYADESNYGGTEIKNKSFRIEKEVRVKDEDGNWIQSDWRDKVTDVEESDVVYFRVEIKNVGEVEVDNMKMEDFLPEELYRIGGDGLTEYWDNFEPGDKETFIIEVKVDADEYDRENFEKCVVNKAELTYDGAFEGADTATVCYGDVEVTELPETGTGSIALLGAGLVLAGSILRKKTRK